jgi:hypothetical protein
MLGHYRAQSRDFEHEDRCGNGSAWFTFAIAVAAHPGAARTDLMRHSPWHFRLVVSRRDRRTARSYGTETRTVTDL